MIMREGIIKMTVMSAQKRLLAERVSLRARHHQEERISLKSESKSATHGSRSTSIYG